MRLNRYIALATGMSRRRADDVIRSSNVTVNGVKAEQGQDVQNDDIILLEGKRITLQPTRTIAFHKPVGYVCSRKGQGSKTIYDLLPAELHALKPVGRLDKDTSGLLIMTNDGVLANKLTHPSFNKTKSYAVRLDKELTEQDEAQLINEGVRLDDGISRFDSIDPMVDGSYDWKVMMHEGRNRQIRRTFEALGYQVTRLHRETFGPYRIDTLGEGSFQVISN